MVILVVKVVFSLKAYLVSFKKMMIPPSKSFCELENVFYEVSKVSVLLPKVQKISLKREAFLLSLFGEKKNISKFFTIWLARTLWIQSPASDIPVVCFHSIDFCETKKLNGTFDLPYHFLNTFAWKLQYFVGLSCMLFLVFLLLAVFFSYNIVCVHRFSFFLNFLFKAVLLIVLLALTMLVALLCRTNFSHFFSRMLVYTRLNKRKCLCLKECFKSSSAANQKLHFV